MKLSRNLAIVAAVFFSGSVWAGNPGMSGMGEWGFGALVEVDGKRWLFDTGHRADTVLNNAAELDLSLEEITDVILSHNHPSGVAEPSDPDRCITRQLQEALQLVDVRVLDHVIVGGGHTVSLAERGMI